MIPCIIIPAARSSVFRKAKENTARYGLSAIALARQAALLLLTVHGYEIPAYAVTNDFYRHTLELDLRSKREYSDAILNAMGGIGKMQFSHYKALLKLSDEALEMADRYRIEEYHLRPVASVAPEYHVEIVRQIIDYTSCTVGIDEAERYHNPKDPGMQQIRRLLNSGYKQGMPAIRLIGEDMKPQAFDVYSPKILAAIMGLEDILARRCIAIPMRRTDKKMHSIPPDFDGASMRHTLYTLALTYFRSVYTNYFERPQLHTLHDRSGELWSPLVALAAFFEEQGGVNGLLDATAAAAANDEQISEGKALSEREEAVLQALELTTRSEEGITWIEASLLREKVAKLIGQPLEKLRDAQWIGHILKRLHLLDEAGRKRGIDGISYAVKPFEVIDMMRRYDVAIIHESR